MGISGLVISGVLSVAISIAVAMLLLRRAIAAVRPGLGEEEVNTLIETRVQPLADENRSQMAKIAKILKPLIADLRELEASRAEDISNWQAALSERLEEELGASAAKFEAISNRLADLEQRSDPSALQEAIDQISADNAQLRESLDEQITQIRDELQAHSADAVAPDQVSDFADRVNAAEAQLSELMAQGVADLDQIESIKTEVEEARGRIAGFEGRVNAAEATLSEFTSQHDADLDHVESVKTEMEDAQARMAGIEESLSAVDARNSASETRLQAALDAHAIASDRLADQVAALTLRMETLERAPEDKPVERNQDLTMPDIGEDDVSVSDQMPHEPAEDAYCATPSAGAAIETALSVPVGMISVMADPSQSEDSEDEIGHRKAG